MGPDMHVIYDPQHLDAPGIQELERHGFRWAGDRALYHPEHWELSSERNFDGFEVGKFSFKPLSGPALAWLHD